MNRALSLIRYLVSFLFILVFCSDLSAALNPSTLAAKYVHLQEVNTRWIYEAAPEGLLDEVNYHSEAERIADHLLLVAVALEKRDISLLTEQQLSNRSQALFLLRAYAKTGRFPVNAHHDERTPYFVDELGTHCAVGHLMRETGATTAVEAIRTETNYGYVLEGLSAHAAIETWGTAHGFTKEELAWIQPDYASLWFRSRAFGNNLGIRGGTISTAATDEQDIFLSRDFTEVDGIQAHGPAYIQGELV